MYTQCPECRTAYRISTAQLRMGQGLVMCSKCDTLFDAISSLSDVAFEDHFSDLRTLPTLPLEQALTPPPEPSPAGTSEIAVAPHWNMPPESGSRRARGGWLSGIVLMLAALVFQVVFFEGNNLVQAPELRPWLEDVCGFMSCKLPGFRDPESIEVLEKSLLPIRPRVLEFRLVFVNGSRIPQAFPRLELNLMRFNGVVLARRVFTPQEYFSGNPSPPTRMAVGRPFTVRLEILNPNEKIGGYHFRLL
ncbi:MAG: DUF3426 domain-containing protein [Gammaproteobacteria bacterium]